MHFQASRLLGRRLLEGKYTLNVRTLYSLSVNLSHGILSPSQLRANGTRSRIGFGYSCPGNIPPGNVSAAADATSGLSCVSTLSAIFNPEVLQVLEDAMLILVEVVEQLSLNMIYS